MGPVFTRPLYLGNSGGDSTKRGGCVTLNVLIHWDLI
jgi:hypothetical protein